MPFIKVWIHFVWSTKNREPFLSSLELRSQVFRHMMDNAREKGIYVDIINGYADHAHCLVSLGISQTISKVVQMIKGESSFWINKNSLCLRKFGWQEQYYGESVSEDRLVKVREYIQNQEEHHSKRTFQQEYDDILSKWGPDKLG